MKDNIKKFLLIYCALWGIISTPLLYYTLNTDYKITYCNNNKCITTKQKIFNYMIGKE